MLRIKKIINFIKTYYEHALLLRLTFLLFLLIFSIITIKYGIYIKNTQSDNLVNKIFTTFSKTTFNSIISVFDAWFEKTKLIASDLNNLYININIPKSKQVLVKRMKRWIANSYSITGIYIINKHGRHIINYPKMITDFRFAEKPYFIDAVKSLNRSEGFIYFYLNDPYILKKFPFYVPPQYGKISMNKETHSYFNIAETIYRLKKIPLTDTRKIEYKGNGEILYCYPIRDYEDNCLAICGVSVKLSALQKKIYDIDAPLNYFIMNNLGYVVMHPNSEFIGYNIKNANLLSDGELNDFIRRMNSSKLTDFKRINNNFYAVLFLSKRLPVYLIIIFGIGEFILFLILSFYFGRTIYEKRTRDVDVVGIFLKFGRDEMGYDIKGLVKYINSKISPMSIIKGNFNVGRLIYAIPIDKRIDKRLKIINRVIERVRIETYNKGFLAVMVSGCIHIDYLSSDAASVEGSIISLFNRVSAVQPVLDNILVSEDVFQHLETNYGIIKTYSLQIGSKGKKQRIIKLR